MLKMKKFIYYFALLFSTVVIGQNTYLHCGKLIDMKSGEVHKSKTIIVSGDKITAIEDGYQQANAACRSAGLSHSPTRHKMNLPARASH